MSTTNHSISGIHFLFDFLEALGSETPRPIYPKRNGCFWSLGRKLVYTILLILDVLGTDKGQLLRPSAASATLHTLSREAFLDNKNGLRALAIGIDAS